MRGSLDEERGGGGEGGRRDDAGRGDAEGKRPLGRRLGWMVVFWLCGVAVLGTVALALRLLMGLAGMKS